MQLFAILRRGGDATMLIRQPTFRGLHQKVLSMKDSIEQKRLTWQREDALAAAAEREHAQEKKALIAALELQLSGKDDA